jgi:IS30 family transposase
MWLIKDRACTLTSDHGSPPTRATLKRSTSNLFAHPYAAGTGTNGNTNGLLREYFRNIVISNLLLISRLNMPVKTEFQTTEIASFQTPFEVFYHTSVTYELTTEK